MKGSYKTRIAVLAAEVVGHRRLVLQAPPLIVFEAEGATTPPEIERARQQGRIVIYAHFVSEGLAECVVDNVPPYVQWGRPEDCPMNVKKLEVNLAKNEIVSHYAKWIRPELERGKNENAR